MKQEWEIFREKYEGFLSDRSIGEYCHIIKLIKEGRLEVRSKSRYDQVRSVLKKCAEIGIELDYRMPKWSKREKREVKNIQDKLIDEEELQLILKSLPRTSKGKELGLAVEISYYSGLRLSEVLGLKAEDITFNGSLRLSVIGKGSKARVTFMPLRFRERLIDDFKGFTITAPYVKNAFRRVLDRLGIKSSFHGLRHSFATNLLN
ncbi:MAG: tyrosine-type recombinase/integrase, partial [Elusimicrobiota bacterium]